MNENDVTLSMITILTCKDSKITSFTAHRVLQHEGFLLFHRVF